MISKNSLIKINEYLWEIPQSFRSDMRVPARVYASEKMLDEISRDKSLEQLVNVATLPEINKYAIAMPDIHEGYGFPIGGVAAMSHPHGVISPGGIGYDINCGVRLLASQKTFKDAEGRVENLAAELYEEIPSGVGRGGKLKLNDKEMDAVLENGVNWLIEKGYAEKNDLDSIESGGCLKEARAELVSDTAKSRGRDQLGTMGAGNHFVEVDIVEEIFPAKGGLASGEDNSFGLFKNQIVILIHCGSRGLGHQVATDYIKIMVRNLNKYKIKLPDLELACAPFDSEEGKNYFAAMSAAANFAWANRQMITWHTRNVWKEIFGNDRLKLVYDVAHNIAKIEEYGGKKMIIHRKGATRAFPKQPVIIPGSMGTSSYVLIGTEKAMSESFGSVCHGAGRIMSRHQALKQKQGKEVKEGLNKEGITIKTGSIRGLAEEAPYAYKDVDEVVNVVAAAGIAQKIARLKPIAVIKG